MFLFNELTNTANYMLSLWRETGALNDLHNAIDNLGYNDAGLLCARLRQMPENALATYIEARRFK